MGATQSRSAAKPFARSGLKLPPFQRGLHSKVEPIRRLLDRGLIVDSPDIGARKLPDGRYSLYLKGEAGTTIFAAAAGGGTPPTPGTPTAPFTEFYMQSGGSNLNAGSTNNNTAAYTSASGNWTQATRVFTVQDGTNPSTSVSVGDFASVYPDGSSNGVYIGRVSAVQNLVNGTITIDATAIYGAAPTNGTANRTIKVGGAWSGPSGGTAFPFGIGGTMGTLLNTAGNHVRLNAKNDQTYTVTSVLIMDGLGGATMQGYSSTVGDGGKATFTSNVTSGNNFSTTSSSGHSFIDLVFVSTGGSGSNSTCNIATNTALFLRCVFHGARGSGLSFSANATLLAIECEAYDCNKSNTANLGGFGSGSNGTGTGFICIYCYSHDHTGGTNGHGFASGSSGHGFTLINCVAESCGGNGLHYNSNASNGIMALNCNFYNNTGDGIKLANTSQALFAYIANNNFIKNSGKGINNSGVVAQTGITYNNGYGSGTQANGSSDTLNSIIDGATGVTYASNVTPWVAPTTGNFSTNLTAASGTGRGAFTETDGTNSGTVGYPDIGAAMHQDV